MYVLLETMGQDPDVDAQRYETVIGEALEAGVVKDAIIAKSGRESTDLWTVRDSPGEWTRTPHWPQLGFDVSVPTGEIEALMTEIEAELNRRWPQLKTVYFGHVADGNLHASVRMNGHSVPELDIEDAVYRIVLSPQGLDFRRAWHRLAQAQIPGLFTQPRGACPHARDQAGDGSERRS